MITIDKKYSIFHIDGGLGKHVAATAVAKAIKNNHPDRILVVVCQYPEIFLNLDFVGRAYRAGMTPYFYDDFIKGKDSIIFRQEPYFTTDHIINKIPLIENWCKMFDLNYGSESPTIVLNLEQKDLAVSKWSRDKPILLLHTNGGPMTGQAHANAWCRDMPRDTAQAIARHHIDKGYHVIQVCRSHENALPDVEVVAGVMSNIELFSLLLLSDKRVLIDSSLQHGAAAFGLPSTVLWVGTSPNIFGYSINTNIVCRIPNVVKLPDSYLFDYNFTGHVHECPILDSPIFNNDMVLAAIDII